MSLLILYDNVIRVYFKSDTLAYEIRETSFSSVTKSIGLMLGLDGSQIELSKKSMEMSPKPVLHQIDRVCGISVLTPCVRNLWKIQRVAHVVDKLGQYTSL